MDGLKRPPCLRESPENLRRPMPLGRKLRRLVQNDRIKLRTRSSCCENHGEPGC